MLKLDLGKPLRMHISGDTGTAQSRVAKAVKYLIFSHSKPCAISAASPTGIQAVLINGETVHSKFLKIWKHFWRIETEGINRWSNIHLLLWDEQSVTDQRKA